MNAVDCTYILTFFFGLVWHSDGIAHRERGNTFGEIHWILRLFLFALSFCCLVFRVSKILCFSIPTGRVAVSTRFVRLEWEFVEVWWRI